MFSNISNHAIFYKISHIIGRDTYEKKEKKIMFLNNDYKIYMYNDKLWDDIPNAILWM